MAGQLKEKFAEKSKALGAEIKNLIQNSGSQVISQVTIESVYQGMRGVKGLATETSHLDPNEGIRFRGFSIPEIRAKLPKAPGDDEPLPEGIFYLLLTGELPTKADCDAITREWHERSFVPDHVWKTLDGLPKDTHPMTQLSIGILAMQTESVFAKKYRDGVHKSQYWEAYFEDAMNLIAKLPHVAAYIYRRAYKDGKRIPADKGLDWGANFARMMGMNKPEFDKLMRLYLVIHSDHEGGNVSAHATHLVGSALSDCYYSFSAGINGLAGPLHGLANQEVIRWIMEAQEKLGGGTPTKEQIEKFLWDTLKAGQVIPGYGHAVLRVTDPRYVAQREFALKHIKDDPIFTIVSLIYEVAPRVLTEHGKTKNPWPNVDAHSGCLLAYYGVKEYDFYTVLFGVSRALGVMASLCWDRALGLSIERPNSVTTEWIKAQVKK